MNKTILQIPMDSDLKKQAQNMAVASGFSSVQEVVRVFLHKFAHQKIEVKLLDTTVQLSPAAEKRYEKLTKDIEEGRNIFKADSVDELMKQLHADTLS